MRIPHINAEIGLLIGTNVPKASEPEEVIRSVSDGPVSISVSVTILGWTVNGPLRDSNCEPTGYGVTYITSNRISVVKLDRFGTFDTVEYTILKNTSCVLYLTVVLLIRESH